MTQDDLLYPKWLRAKIRPHLWTISPYSSARSEHPYDSSGLFLDANECPYDTGWNRYPDPFHRKVREKLARWLRVTPEEVLLGNGSDEVLDLLVSAFCEPQKHAILITPPTFGMYEFLARIRGIAVRKAPLDRETFALPIPQILSVLQQDPSIRMVILCSPNNPTGNTFPIGDILKLAQEWENGWIVIDEAYAEFSGTTLIPMFREYPQICVVRTFSKAWGLAGLRAGYLVAHPSVVQFLYRIQLPYNVSAHTQNVLLRLLSPQGIQAMEKRVQEWIQQREKLAEELQKFPFVRRVYPSEANFLLVQVKNARALVEFLRKQARIWIRDRSDPLYCPECVRITVGTPEQNQLLLKVLNAFASHLNFSGV